MNKKKALSNYSLW